MWENVQENWQIPIYSPETKAPLGRFYVMIIFTDRRSRTKQPLKRVTGGPLRSGATK